MYFVISCFNLYHVRQTAIKLYILYIYSNNIILLEKYRYSYSTCYGVFYNGSKKLICSIEKENIHRGRLDICSRPLSEPVVLILISMGWAPPGIVTMGGGKLRRRRKVCQIWALFHNFYAKIGAKYFRRKCIEIWGYFFLFFMLK